MGYKIRDFKNIGIYNNRQLHEIEMGLKNGIDVRYYLGENFNENQMHQIRMLQQFRKETGREDIEINIIANCNLDYKQMGVIRQAYELGMNTEQVFVLANPMLNREQMSQLKEMFLNGSSIEDVKNVAFPVYDFQHLWVIREVYENIKSKELLVEDLFNWESSLEKILEVKEEIMRSKDNELYGIEDHKEYEVNEKKGIKAAIEDIKKENQENENSNRQKNNSIDR